MLKKCLLAGVALLLATGLHAQQTSDLLTSRLLGTRAELQAQLQELQATAASSAYSSTLRNRAREQAAILERRLEDGDFRTGDRIVITVDGEALVSDTLQVVSGPSVIFPEIGAVGLDGVLRSELRDHLAEELGRFIRNPRVRNAQVLIGLQFSGAVGQQGVHYIPAEAPLGDAFRFPGLAGDAAMNEVRIRRGGQVIWDDEAVQEAVQEFRTLDQMSLQAGDEILVPQDQRSGNWLTWLQVGAGLLTSVVLLTRVF